MKKQVVLMCVLLLILIGLLFMVAEFILNTNLREKVLYGQASSLHAIAAKKLNTPFDSRNKLEFTKFLRQKGESVVPFAASIQLRHLLPKNIYPLAGISNSKTVLCNESGEFATYYSDAFGFNNLNSAWENPQIALLGDSFVHGACLPKELNLASQLGKTKLLNLGVSAAGPLTELAVLKEYLQLLRPKKVLWFFYEGNDLKDLIKEQKSPALLKYFQNETQNLFSRQKEIDDALIKIIDKMIEENSNESGERLDASFVERFYHGFFEATDFRSLRNAIGLLTGTRNDPHVLFEKIIIEAQKSVRAWGGELYFVYLPSWEKYAKNIEYDPQNKIPLFLKEKSIPFIDGREAFRANSDPLSLFYFRQNGHYNPEGVSLMAKYIRQHLEK